MASAGQWLQELAEKLLLLRRVSCVQCHGGMIQECRWDSSRQGRTPPLHCSYQSDQQQPWPYADSVIFFSNHGTILHLKRHMLAAAQMKGACMPLTCDAGFRVEMRYTTLRLYARNLMGSWSSSQITCKRNTHPSHKPCEGHCLGGVLTSFWAPAMQLVSCGPDCQALHDSKLRLPFA